MKSQSVFIQILYDPDPKNMSEPTSKEIRWRNGYWANDKMPSNILIIEEEKLVAKPIIALDYPDIGVDNGVTAIKFGDFGPARKEIVEATGAS